jgi:hypothetical protein
MAPGSIPLNLGHPVVPDIMLSLYAADGDVIVTGDKMFTKLFRHSESDGRVKVMTWMECLDTFLNLRQK